MGIRTNGNSRLICPDLNTEKVITCKSSRKWPFFSFGMILVNSRGMESTIRHKELSLLAGILVAGIAVLLLGLQWFDFSLSNSFSFVHPAQDNARIDTQLLSKLLVLKEYFSIQ